MAPPYGARRRNIPTGRRRNKGEQWGHSSGGRQRFGEDGTWVTGASRTGHQRPTGHSRVNKVTQSALGSRLGHRTADRVTGSGYCWVTVGHIYNKPVIGLGNVGQPTLPSSGQL